MKKFNKVCVCIIAALSLPLGCVFALDFNDISIGTASLVSETTKSYELSDGLAKKEETSVTCYEYPKDLKDFPYKYITVHKDFTYFNSTTNKILGVAIIESNFRYNTVTRQAECLSTSRGSVINDQSCTLSVCSRKANLRTDLGNSSAEVKFANKGKTYDTNAYRISCDYVGNISYV
jgi:hypothetical protein